MKLTTQHYTVSMPVFWVFFLSAFLLSFIQWQFSKLTGSALVFGLGLLQLSLCILFLFNGLKSNRNRQLLAQFLTSFFILGLCGLLINESYIHWQENVVILTREAFPVVFLGVIGALFLSRLIYSIVKQEIPSKEPQIGRKIISTLSVCIALGLLTVHFTGWMWLDALMAALIGLLLGITAIFFIMDSYWNIMDVREGA